MSKAATSSALNLGSKRPTGEPGTALLEFWPNASPVVITGPRTITVARSKRRVKEIRLLGAEENVIPVFISPIVKTELMSNLVLEHI